MEASAQTKKNSERNYEKNLGGSWEKKHLRSLRISTGSSDLNAWLNGGYESGVITTLYGPAGSGKTNLCLVAASYVAKSKKVIFIDTEGGLSISRLRQLTSDYNSIKNIFLLKATSFSEQREAFNKLLDLIMENKDIGLIIVDSMVMLYRLELGQAKEKEKIQIINRSLARQMRILSEIARKRFIPILITDQVYSKFLSKEDFEAGKEKEVSMVGGDIMKYWSKCIIELQNLGRNKKKAILKKHRSLPEKEFVFSITNKGIKKSFRFF